MYIISLYNMCIYIYIYTHIAVVVGLPHGTYERQEGSTCCHVYVLRVVSMLIVL